MRNLPFGSLQQRGKRAFGYGQRLSNGWRRYGRRKLAEEAHRRRRDLKVLYTTGYTRNAVVHNGVLDPGVQMIGKPFTIEELASKVREVLDASG